jgi:hypothetical protein
LFYQLPDLVLLCQQHKDIRYEAEPGTYQQCYQDYRRQWNMEFRGKQINADNLCIAEGKSGYEDYQGYKYQQD